ncbi:heme oxygenase-like, multi-helical [Trema orientale]|uniref:Heme oxygenase-like, multi-helical n=1 Tax=Trema orientale TaxID=63057 RepID=A0A2P5C0M1_TREOI|nr:heme oxygenase-like, multi-helical [Trema orientale]
MAEVEEEIAEQYWKKYKKESVFALLSPFSVSLTAGDLDSRTFCYCIAQDLHFLKLSPQVYETALGCVHGSDQKKRIGELRGYVRTRILCPDSLSAPLSTH